MATSAQIAAALQTLKDRAHGVEAALDTLLAEARNCFEAAARAEARGNLDRAASRRAEGEELLDLVDAARRDIRQAYAEPPWPADWRVWEPPPELLPPTEGI